MLEATGPTGDAGVGPASRRVGVLTSALADSGTRDTALEGVVSQTVAASHGWPTGHVAAVAVAGTGEIACVLTTARKLARLRSSGRIR